jgi:hypothetical protein
VSQISSESVLARITTHWSQVSNPVQFVARYAPAIHKYFQALIRHPQEADDAAQDFLARISQGGFSEVTVNRGRFRDYLTVAVKNSALNHLKRVQRHRTVQVDAFDAAVSDEILFDADAQWLANWQQCVLEQAWRGLFHHQRNSPGNLFHTILKLRSENADLDDATLAARAAEMAGRGLRPDAFRKQLSRARRMFAELIVEEVARMLEQPTPDRVEEELIDTGLMPFVRPFLSADWRERGLLSDTES